MLKFVTTLSHLNLTDPRNLEKSDFHKGYLELLSHLSKTTQVSFSEFCTQIDELSSSVWVIEDLIASKVVSSGSLLLEKKLIRNGGRVGHIEDVVVHPDYQQNGLGKKMVSHLIQISKTLGCYKVILNCSPSLTKFYKSCGFEKTAEQMSMYFLNLHGNE